jgi:hypothetical protein
MSAAPGWGFSGRGLFGWRLSRRLFDGRFRFRRFSSGRLPERRIFLWRPFYGRFFYRRSFRLHQTEATYMLSGKIEQLEEVDHDRDVRVVCRISAQLLETRTRSVIWSHTASETISVEERDMGGVVSSLSAAARTAADRLLTSMTEEVLATMALSGRTANSVATSAGTAAR